MNKQEFIGNLRVNLSGLPKSDVEERLNFYSEIIDDRVEEGLSEEEAVLELGNADEVASQIIEEIPFAKIARERIKTRRRLRVWEITLLAVGSPIWISLIISAIAVVVSLYASLWAAVISLWAVFVSFIASALGCVAGGIGLAVLGEGIVGLACIGAGLITAGLAVFSFYGCKSATGGVCVLAKKIILGIKKYFVKKEEV